MFGSSTPRELTYLEKISSEQKISLNTRGDSNTPPSRTPSRIVPGVMAGPTRFQPSNLMTRSVFGTLQNDKKSAASLPRNKLAPPSSKNLRGSTPVLKKTSVTNSNSSVLSGAAMTQSLYVQKSKPLVTLKKSNLFINKLN